MSDTSTAVDTGQSVPPESNSGRSGIRFQIILFSVLLVFGFFLGSAVGAQDIEDLEGLYLVITRWLAPGKLEIIYPDVEPFGRASLKSPANNVSGAQIFDHRMELIDEFDENSRYKYLARGVGRLDLLVEYAERVDGRDKKEDKIEPCSAILATARLIVTAHHCTVHRKTGRSYKIHKASFRLGYHNDENEKKDSQKPPSIGLKVKTTPIELNSELDYAVFELEADQLATTQGRFAPIAIAASDIVNGQDLIVLHHPLGGTMFATRSKCRVTEYPLKVPGDQEKGMFKHSCGTLPATSGAPIFDERTGKVVALHVRGDDSIDSTAENIGLGVPFELIASATMISELKACIQTDPFAPDASRSAICRGP